VPPEPKVFVLLTEAEFIALTPLPALAAAGLLAPPEDEGYGALLDALREGAFKPCDGVFIGSVPMGCVDALRNLAVLAHNRLDGGGKFAAGLGMIPGFIDAIRLYGGKLVRA
jgi:hypothetical protein